MFFDGLFRFTGSVGSALHWPMQSVLSTSPSDCFQLLIVFSFSLLLAVLATPLGWLFFCFFFALVFSTVRLNDQTLANLRLSPLRLLLIRCRFLSPLRPPGTQAFYAF